MVECGKRIIAAKKDVYGRDVWYDVKGPYEENGKYVWCLCSKDLVTRVVEVSLLESLISDGAKIVTSQITYQIAPVKGTKEIKSIEIDLNGFGHATPEKDIFFTGNMAGTYLYATVWGRDDSEELRKEICEKAMAYLPLHAWE